jgi:uncharacterized protein DUF6880
VPAIAAKIAGRLLTAGRTDEAGQILEATEHRRGGWPDFEWEDARIDVLDARACSDEAQAARWSCFERALSAPHLREYLNRLPDFEDLEAEQRALNHAERYGSLLQAISFSCIMAFPGQSCANDHCPRQRVGWRPLRASDPGG